MKKIFPLFIAVCLFVNKMNSQPVTFSYTGAVQTYTVASCVNSITMDVRGAAGAAVSTSYSAGGKGGRVQATIPVTPGQVLNIYVGQMAPSATGGWNGGGNGGSGAGGAGGGGGASDIRQGGIALTNRVIVASGGGGGGYDHAHVYVNTGGQGGGTTGSDGVSNSGQTLANRGRGGTPAAGGAGGTGSNGNGNPGTLGSGGNADATYGGGGGSGYYGGGGGTQSDLFTFGGGGGGGSSYAIGTATGVTHTQAFQTGNGQIIITPSAASGPATPGAITGATSVCAWSSATYSISAVPTATTYSWTIPAGATISGQGTTSVTVTFGTTSGNISVTASNSCGTSSASTKAVTVNASPTANAGSDETICSGQSATLSASGGTNYLWSTGATTASVTVVPAVTTTYTVTVSDASGCSGNDEVLVTVNSAMANAGMDATICTGGTTTLTATGGVSYLWNTGDTDASITVTPTATTTYTVLVTDAFGCSGIDDVMVTIGSSLSANAGNDLTICTGSTATLTASGGTTYLWSTGDTDASIMVTPATTTTYSVLATDASGCSGTDEVTVTVNPNAMADAGADVSICNSSSTTLNGTGNGTYLWSPSTGLSDPTISNPTANPASTITYTLTVTNNCGSASDDVTVTITTTPSVNAGSDETMCVGGSVQLNAAGSGTFSWTPAAGLSCTNCPNPLATPNTSTTYTVTITDVCGTASDEVMITVDSCLTGISSVTTNLNILISPNPTNGQFRIQGSEFRVQSLEIYNVMGEKVCEVPSNSLPSRGQGWPLDLSASPTGIYFVKVITENEIVILKLVKQ